MKPLTLDWIEKAEEDWVIMLKATGHEKTQPTTLLAFTANNALKNT